jgi:signal transduction histidine kinase
LYREASLSRSGLDAFQREESIFVFLTLFLLVFLLVFHKLFAPLLGVPSPTLVLIVIAGFTLKTLELIWLQKLRRPLTPVELALLTWASIGLNLSLALLLGAACDCEDSPYFILLIVPVLEAAFRFSLATVAGVIAAVSFVDLLSVWLYFHRHPAMETSEYLEAGIGSLMFAIVGSVVWLLVRGLRRAESHLGDQERELQDARERRLQEEKLAAVGRLSHAIAHEIRNPVVLISSSIAAARKLSGSEQTEMLRVASEETSRLVSVTSDFLSYAHFQPPRRVPVSVADTAYCVVEACRAHASQKGILLRVQARGMLVISADPGQLQQALLHLTMNAVEASPSRGVIHVKVYSRDLQVLVEIENSGNPVSDAHLSRIFEPFFTTKERGAGLGLSIARNIARSHGGDLLLVANQPQRVCFSLQLPSPNGKTGFSREENGQNSSRRRRG